MTLFSCCEGFTPDTDLVDWMKQHRRPSIANYVNCRGRTVRQVREEAALRDAIESHLASNACGVSRSFAAGDPREACGSSSVRRNPAGRLTLSAESATPLGWWIANKLHLIGLPLLFLLLASPLLLVRRRSICSRLRHLEKTDPEVCPTVDQEYSEDLARSEDHDVTNQFSAMGSLKPGLVRLVTTIGVLTTVDYAARHIVSRGRLGRIRTIHFARWVFLDGTQRMAFFSNYDGSVESYMDDFINKTGFGLNASFSNGIGYPRTNWLVLDGCADERKIQGIPPPSHDPDASLVQGLSRFDGDRPGAKHAHPPGLESSFMSDQEAREWVALL